MDHISTTLLMVCSLAMDKKSNELDALRYALKSQVEQNQQLMHEIEALRHQIDKLTHMLFGTRSERKKAKEMTQDNNDTEEIFTTSNPKQPSENQPKRQPLPKDLPREKVRYDLAESERACYECGQYCRMIGKEVSEQLDVIPAKLFVRQFIRYKYACPSGCTVKTAPMPRQPIDKGLAGPGLLADVLMAKYQDALPLYRQSLRFKRHGITLADSTLCDWVAQSASLLEPLVHAMKEHILMGRKIHTDDTVVPVLAKGKTKKARLWTYVADGCDGFKATVYDFTPTRSQQGPIRFLSGFKGYLQADAYAGYDVLYENGDIIEVGCLAHARRKFMDIIKSSKKTGLADDAVELIGRIYAVEKRIKHLSAKERYYYRKRHLKPHYHRLKKWLLCTQKQVIPKTPIGAAINYALNHWQALQNVLRDGICKVDNNTAERAIKPVVIGRKNYLFAGSNEGGKRAAIIYSLIETCKQNEINTFDYLSDVLTRLPSHKAKFIDELLPFRWKKSD